MAGREGSDKPEKFKSNVAEDLASASGLPPANFRIKDASQDTGSIILDVEVMPDPLAFRTHLLAVKALAEQVVDPSSKLRSGMITIHATGVEVIPPKSREVPAAKSENDKKNLQTLQEEFSWLEKKIRELSKDEDEIREQISATRASLEASKAETASAKAALEPKDAQVDELKRWLAVMKEQLEKMRKEEGNN
jgi:hypothetical protein